MARALWSCSCQGVTHDEGEPSCTVCGFVRPDSLDPLPDDWNMRLQSIADWLDRELARRPKLLVTVNGSGMMALIRGVKNEPRSTYRQLASTGKLLGAVIGWVEQATPPDMDTFTDALGPPES